jgi:biopolymer transport protein ExbD
MNVTPFVDVLLVLLIVFIIAAPLATTSIKVDLAAGNGRGGRTPVNVMIDDRGGVSLQSATAGTLPTSLARLSGDLTKLAGASAPIVITGAAHTRYGAFMAVMDRLHGAGFTDVTLAAKAA